MSKKKLLKNVKKIYTFDNNESIFTNQDILISEQGVIEQIGANIVLPESEVEQTDCSHLIAIPGLVNTHHHFYQTLFRGLAEAQEKPLFPWLKILYQFWQHLDEETVYYGTQVAVSELLRTGCTMSMDHHYVFPQNASGKLIDYQFKAAAELGIRFTATRGSMSRGVDDGGLPPMSVVQKEETILQDSERLINAFHDSSRYSMANLALAPCSPFSVTKSLMQQCKTLSDKHGVMLHTHLAETEDETRYCQEVYKMTPYELMEDIGWLGDRVWFAHGIHFTPDEIRKLKNTGIAHCPSSNMKLGSGICPLLELKEHGVKLSIAVDGSASNDGSNMWEEIKRAYLLNHLKYKSDALSAYEILRMATRGGAEVLGRDDTGYLAKDMAADIVLLDLNGVEYSGCHDDIVSIVNLGNSDFVDKTIVNGQLVAEKGRLVKYDQDKIAREAHQHAMMKVAQKQKG